MNRFSKKSLSVLLAAFAIGLLIAGCGDETTVIESPPPPVPEPVVIDLQGQCIGGATGIVCEDASTTRPSGHVAVVSMIVRDAAGNSVSSTSLSGGCATAPGLPCELEFPGLAPGTYSVRHTVTPDDGGSSASAIYRDVVVTGGGVEAGG